MNLAEMVGKAAPLIGGFLTGGPIGVGAVALKMLASEFGVEEDEAKVAEAIQGDPDAMVKLRKIELDNKSELQRMTLEAETSRLIAVNKTMQMEIQSESKFVKWARPSLIWSVSASVILEVVVGASIILIDKSAMSDYVLLCQAISIPQGVAAAMCGVYLKQRSNDKALAAGVKPGPGLLAGLLGK